MKRRFRTGRAAIVCLSAICIMLLALVSPSNSQTAEDIVVPDGYIAEVLVDAPSGLRFNDVSVTPWGEVIVPLVGSPTTLRTKEMIR